MEIVPKDLCSKLENPDPFIDHGKCCFLANESTFDDRSTFDNGNRFLHPLLAANEQYTLSSQRLSKIIEMQNRFFDLSKDPIKPSDHELTRKAQEIVASYESYLSDNSKDANALILFGKFLDKVGQQDHAVDYFLEADSINPRLAVVKQQIGNYLIEEGRPLDAFPFFMLTLEIEPQQPAYHFHFANYLFLFEDELVEAEIMDLAAKILYARLL